MAELTHADDIATQETLKPLPRPRRGEDITHLFTQASAGMCNRSNVLRTRYADLGAVKSPSKPILMQPALRHGQLVKDEFFTLFESVAALEVSWSLEGPEDTAPDNLLTYTGHGPENGQRLQLARPRRHTGEL